MATNQSNVRIILSGNADNLNDALGKAQDKILGLQNAFSALANTMGVAFSARSAYRGLEAAMGTIDDYRRKVLSIATVLTDTVKGSSDEISKAFAQNQRHAASMFRLFNQQAAKSLSTVNDLLDAYQVFTSRGLSLKADESSVKALSAMIDRINIATEGQQNQVMQEMRAILEGRARPSDITAKIFSARDINFQKNIKMLAASGDGQAVIDYIGSLITDIPLNEQVGKLLSKQKQNIKTAISLWAIDVFSPLYDTISGYIGKLADNINSGNNPFMKGLEDMVKRITDLTKAIGNAGSAFASSGWGKFLLQLSPKLVAITASVWGLATAFKGLSLVMHANMSLWQTLAAAAAAGYMASTQKLEDIAGKMSTGTATEYEAYWAKWLNSIAATLETTLAIIKAGVTGILTIVGRIGEWMADIASYFLQWKSTPLTDQNKREQKNINRFLERNSADNNTLRMAQDAVRYFQEKTASGRTFVDATGQLNFNDTDRLMMSYIKAQDKAEQERWRNMQKAKAQYGVLGAFSFASSPTSVWGEVMRNIITPTPGEANIPEKSAFTFSNWARNFEDDVEKIMRDRSKYALAYTSYEKGVPNAAAQAIIGSKAESESNINAITSRNNQAEVVSQQINAANLSGGIAKAIKENEKALSRIADMESIAAGYAEDASRGANFSYLAEYEKSVADINKKLAKYGVSLDGTAVAQSELEKATNLQSELESRFNAVQMNLTSADETLRSEATALAEQLQAQSAVVASLSKAEEERATAEMLSAARLKAQTEYRDALVNRENAERENYIQALQDATALGKGYTGFGNGFNAGIVNTSATSMSAYDATSNMVVEWTDAGKTAISDSLYNAVMGDGGFRDILNSLGQTILRASTDFISNVVIQYLMKGVQELVIGSSLETAAKEAEATASITAATALGTLSASATAASASLSAMATSSAIRGGAGFLGGLFAADGAVWKGGFTPFAKGGVVTHPTLGLVGEGRYNEAVVPLPDGRSVPVVMTGSAQNGSGEVIVNVNNYSSSEVKTNETTDDLGRRVLEIVIDGANRNKSGFRSNLKAALS